MSENKEQMVYGGRLYRNVDAIKGHACAGCMAKAALAAVIDFQGFQQMPTSATEEDVEEFFAALTRQMSEQVSAFGKARGFSDGELTGLMLHASNFAQVSIVDRLLDTKHPATRLAYLATVQKQMLANSFIDTMQHSVDAGYVGDQSAFKPLIHVYQEFMDEGIPSLTDITHIAEEHADDGEGNEGESALLKALITLTDALPEPVRSEKMGELRRIAKLKGVTWPEDKAPESEPTVTLHKGENGGGVGLIEMDDTGTDEDKAAKIAKILSEQIGREIPADQVLQALKNGSGVIVLPK